MNAFASADEAPVFALGMAAVSETRIPCKWNGDRASIDKADHQDIFGQGHTLGARLADVTP
jgi:hypothetical protein